MRFKTIFGVAVGFLCILAILAIADIALNRSRWIGTETDTSASTDESASQDVIALIRQAGLTDKETSEPSVLSIVLGENAGIQSRVLLAPSDRGAFIAWADSLDAEEDFTRIKTMVHGSFSSGMRDLIDEVQLQSGKRPREVLSFIDPVIHPERLLFVRSGNRLYEFHITPGYEQQVDELLNLLTD